MSVFGLLRQAFCGPAKTAIAVLAKQVFVLAARDAGASVNQVAGLAGIDPSNVSRHYDDARHAIATDSKLRYAKELVDRLCAENAKKSQA